MLGSTRASRSASQTLSASSIPPSGCSALWARSREAEEADEALTEFEAAARAERGPGGWTGRAWCCQVPRHRRRV